MEEYTNDGRFSRRTEEPTTAKRESSPRKARLTGASLAGFLENRKNGKLDQKMQKYDEEYERLMALAAKVDEGRDEVDKGNLDYAEVQKSIKAYNAQARRLADIGVEVLVLNQDIQKITFSKESAAKAIKVPSFLIGPLRMLSAAGREQARLEKQAREERENAIFEAIVATAEEAIGQVKNSEIDEAKLNSLELGNVADVVRNDLVGEPTTDIPVEEEVKDETVVVETPVEETPTVVVEPEKSAEELAAEAEKRKAEAAEAVAKRNEAINQGLNNAYKNIPNPKKYREIEATVKKAVAENDDFAILANVAGSFHIALVKNGTGHAQMLESFVNGERQLVYPSLFAKMSGLEDKDEIKANYMNMVAMTKFASHWAATAAYDLQESEDSVKHVEAFGEENSNLFNFVIANVRDGLTAEEITAKANEELSAVEASVVTAVVAKYDVVKDGVVALDSFMVEKEKSVEVEAEEVLEDEDMIAKQRKAVADTIARLAISTKYGVKNNTEDEVVEEVVVENTNNGEGVVAVEEDEDTLGADTTEVVTEAPVEEEPVVAKKTGTSYVDQISGLVDEIASLCASRDRIKELLGEDVVNSELTALNDSISSKIAQINALAMGGIVTLGKDEPVNENVEEEVIAEEAVVEGDSLGGDTTEVVEAPVEEAVVAEEPVVVQDAASIELSIEEKAEIDARVVNGAHVKVDAIIENFVPGKKYVLEASVKGKKATVIVEDEEEQLVEAPVEETVAEEAVVEGDGLTGETTVVVEAPAEEPVVEEAITEGAAEVEEEVIDEEHADVIDWWTNMAPALDDPDVQMSLRLSGARKEADRLAEQINHDIDRRNWEANRSQRIADGWLPLDEEARQARIAEQERLAEQIARNKLKKCKLFEGIDDPDDYIDGIIAENDDLNNARDVVEMIRTKAPEAYKEMETRYRDEQHGKLAAISEEAKGRSK